LELCKRAAIKKHLKYEEEGDSEDGNVLIEEEIDNEIEANALQGEEDLQNDKFLAVSYNQLDFFVCLEYSGGSGRLLLRKGKPLTFFALIQFYKM